MGQAFCVPCICMQHWLCSQADFALLYLHLLGRRVFSIRPHRKKKKNFKEPRNVCFQELYYKTLTVYVLINIRKWKPNTNIYFFTENQGMYERHTFSTHKQIIFQSFSSLPDRWDWDVLFAQKGNINLNNLKT